MELKITDIVESAAKIIEEAGMTALSIEDLAGEMKIDHSLLYPYIKKRGKIKRYLKLNVHQGLWLIPF